MSAANRTHILTGRPAMPYRRACCLLATWMGATAVANADEPPADLVIVNGKILTVDATFRQASAVAIKNGRFVAVGSEPEVRPRVGGATRVIDAKGKTVVPGLIETHVHPTKSARGEAEEPFAQLHSIAEIQNWVRQKAADLGPGRWIQLPRVDATRIRERRIPTSEELDAAAPNNPAVFTWQYANRRLQVLNRAALRAANITKESVPGRGGKIHLGADDEPNGVIENSGALLTRFLSARSVSDAKFEAALEQLLRRYSELGIASITERTPRAENFAVYQKLKAAGRLPVRVTVTVGIATDGSVQGTEKAIRALPLTPQQGDEWVKAGPIKFGVDGGILYGTAYMREPYGEKSFRLYGISDARYRGDLRFNAEQLKNIIRTGHRLGWQMSSHVTGDAGVDAILDAVEAADADQPIAPRRYNLIHAYFPDRATAERAARLGVAVDTQPAWYFKDADALAEALGTERLQKFIGLKTWRDAGVKVAINSDHMQGFDPDTSLNPFNPFLAMSVAISRQTEAGQVFGADERISREDALRALTIDAAWLSFDENIKGSIEVGKVGDLAVLSDDLMSCALDKMKDVRSVLTIVGGNVVFER